MAAPPETARVAIPELEAVRRVHRAHRVHPVHPVRPGAWAEVVVQVVEWPVRPARRAPEWSIHA